MDLPDHVPASANFELDVPLPWWLVTILALFAVGLFLLMGLWLAP